MARLLWLFLGCLLLLTCGPIFPVMGLDDYNDDDVRAKATDIVVARGVSRKLLQQSTATDAAANLKIEEDKLKSEIEKEVLAQVEEKLKQAMHLEKDTQAVQQKTDAVVEDAEKRRKEEEAQRKRMEEEAERKRKEEEERKRKEEEKRKKEEEERKRKEEEERKRKEEEERKHKEEEERKRKEEEERKRKEEEERKRKEEEERKHKEEEERKRKEEEEKKRKEEEAKKQKEEEAKKQKEEEERKKKEEEERKQKEEEEEMNFQHILDTKIIPELKQRCSTFPKWTAPQVERCLNFAEDGIEYDPLIFDLDNDDFSSMVVNPTLNSIGHQHEPTSALKSLLKVAFLIALVVAYLRHVNWFRKNRLWNAMILKSRTLLFHVSKHKQQNRHHRHAG